MRLKTVLKNRIIFGLWLLLIVHFFTPYFHLSDKCNFVFSWINNFPYISMYIVLISRPSFNYSISEALYSSTMFGIAGILSKFFREKLDICAALDMIPNEINVLHWVDKSLFHGPPLKVMKISLKISFSTTRAWVISIIECMDLSRTICWMFLPLIRIVRSLGPS